MPKSTTRGALLASLLFLSQGCGPPPRSRPPAQETPASEEMQEEMRAAGRAAYARGTYLREQGDVAGALRLYAEGVRITPRTPELRFAYAELLVEVGRAHDARLFLESALERFAGSGREHLLLARLRLVAGDSARALAGADTALGRDPGLAAAWLLRGRLLLDADRTAEARTSFARADSLAPGDPGTLAGLAECSDRLGQRSEAVGYLERALQLDPTLVTARRSLATLYRAEGRRDDVARLARQGIEAAPDDPEQLDAALEMLLQGGDLDAAAALLRPYHERQALPPRTAALYGRLLLQLDRLAAADSVLAPLAGVDDLHGIDTLLGDVAARAGRIAEARAHYRRAMDREPDDCVPSASLALLDVQQRRAGTAAAADSTEIAATLAAAVRQAGPENYRCHLLLGLAFATEKRWADAARHLETAHELDPENGDVMLELAMAKQELGEFEAALGTARALLALEPDNPAALNFVGYIQAERGQELAASEALIRRAVDKEPDNGYFVDSLGWVLYQKGDYAGAATELERAVHLTEERDALILEHLGDAYVEIGRLDAAHRVYTLSRRLAPQRQVLVEKLGRVEARLGRP